jgi:hypothetical protein
MKIALRISFPVLFFILALGASAPLAFAATIYVDASAVGTGDGSSLEDAFLTIPDAITDAANTGDVINVADGEYILSGTLDISKSVTLSGTSQGGTIIDASAVNGYGIAPNNADGIVLENFTLAGPTANSIGKYGIKAYDLTNFTVRNVTVHGSGRSEVDLNRVTGTSLLENVTANGEDTAGVGIALSNSDGVTLRNITTLGNTWGGVGLYDYSTGPTSNIVFDGSTSIGESTSIYIDAEYGFGVSNITLPPGYGWAVRNTVFRESEGVGRSDDFTLFQSSKDNAVAAALEIQQAPYDVNTVSTIQTVAADGSLENNFIVGDGMSIQAAISAASSGDTINVAAGTYEEDQITIDHSLTLVGAGVGETIIDGQDASLTDTGLIRITADADVSVSNLTLQNAGGTGSGDTKIRMAILADGPATSGNTYMVDNVEIIGSQDSNAEQDYGFYVRAGSGDGKVVFSNSSITGTGANPIVV